jgi:general secretion pathway protein B
VSIILDALHRSDREREQVNTVPGLQTYHGNSAIQEPAYKRLFWAVLLLVPLFALGWFLLRGDSPGVVTAAPPQADTRGSAMVRQEVAAAQQATKVVRQEEKTVVPSLPVSRPELEVAAEIDIADPGVVALYQRTDARSGTVPVAEAVPAVAKSPAAAAVPAEQEVSAIPVDELLAAASNELMALDSNEDSTPLLQSLPQRIKDEIPSIFYSNHSWSSSSGEKEVTLNGEIHREGDVIVKDVRLLEIQPDYIILEYKDNRFRLRALNSWVNL